MEFLPQDLRGATDQAGRASACPSKNMCRGCVSCPAPGSKLRYCGRCEVAAYCSQQCARADWDTHKLVCETENRAHKDALASFVAGGGRTRDFNQAGRNIDIQFEKVRGLFNEIELLAWRSRSQNPLILASALDTDVDGSTIRIQMMPRHLWDDDPCFLADTFTDAQREAIRDVFGESLLCSNTLYTYVLCIVRPGIPNSVRIAQRHFEANDAVRAVEIVEALTAATRPEDLVDAFAWFDAIHAQDMVHWLKQRATLVHGCITPIGSMPVPNRALNTEVAYMLLHTLDIAFDIRLTGLRAAMHLNGREGVIRGQEPGSLERWRVRLENGTCVSVKAVNLVHVRRVKYTRISP